MTDSAQLNPGPVITTPDASVEGMVAPGQENLLEEFIQEQEAAQEEEPEKLLGKFNSTEDLARAYQQLERRLGQQSQDSPSDSQPAPEGSGYTAEQATEIYGADAVESLAGKGINMADLMWQADQGGDISEHYDTLAETFNVSRQMVENYVTSAQAGGGDEAVELDASQQSAIKEMVGGEQGFAELSEWAKNNLDQAELDSYNAVANSGNVDGIVWALKAIQARRAAPDAVVEPKLLGGTAPAAPTTFESEQQVLDAMNKKNERGQKLYEVDEAYRNKVMALLAKSNVF